MCATSSARSDRHGKAGCHVGRQGGNAAIAGWYILKDRKPVAEPDLQRAMQWHEHNQDSRFVARTRIGEVGVSTVFTGTSAGNGATGPLVFETHIFGGAHHDKTAHSATWTDAEACHARLCELVRLSIN